MNLSRFFCTTASTRMSQVISACAFGILLAPFGSGLFFLVVFRVVYETFYYIMTKGNPLYWDLFTRCCVFYSSLFGWVIGRTLLEMNILEPGVPEII